MIKPLFIKEAFVATMLVMLITYLISFIPLSLEYGKALHQGFTDFDTYDLYYSGKDKQNTIVNKNIVLVELGEERAEIADEIKTISKYGPAIIAIDATFESQRDSARDLKLSEEIKQHNNIVLATAFDKQKLLVPNIFYSGDSNASSGFIDFSSNPEYAVIRSYVPFININGNQYEAFTSAIARKFDIEKYNELKNRSNSVELINYTGNLNNYLSITKNDLRTLDDQQLSTLIKNKIILIGFFVKNPPLIMEDLYYSPLNERVSGKCFPDMYGVVVHANILSMILKSSYATLASKTTAYLFAFLITFCFNLYIISKFHKKTHPAHAGFILVQFIIIMLFLYFFLMVYNWFLFKVPLEPIMISMVLSLELLGLYKNIASWLHKKYGYKTIFAHKHII